MPRPIPTFCGDLVTLRPIRIESDANDYFAFNLDPEMHQWTDNVPFATLDEARAELARLQDLRDLSTWMILENHSGTIVGRFFLCIEEREGRRIAGEGNRIARAYWRCGHNREARRLMFDYAFGSLGADTYETACWSGNLNSCRSIESYGFLLFDEREEQFRKRNEKTLMRHYRMVRAQWLSTGR